MSGYLTITPGTPAVQDGFAPVFFLYPAAQISPRGQTLAIDVDQYYRKYGAMVFRRCLQMLGDEAAAQDAVQEVFLALLKKQSSLKDEFMSSLLYRIATNHCLNIIKRSKKTVTKDDSFFSSISGKDDFSENVQARDVLAQLFAGEKADTMEIAVMRYVDGLGYEEIAALTKLSVSGIRKRLRKLSEKAAAFKGAFYG